MTEDEKPPISFTDKKFLVSPWLRGEVDWLCDIPTGMTRVEREPTDDTELQERLEELREGRRLPGVIG